jgi:hypothetical protein
MSKIKSRNVKQNANERIPGPESRILDESLPYLIFDATFS